MLFDLLHHVAVVSQGIVTPAGQLLYYTPAYPRW